MKTHKRHLRARSYKEKYRFKQLNNILVFKSNKHLYAHLVKNKQIVSTQSTLSPEMQGLSRKDAASLIGEKIAEKALSLDITKASFNRNGFKYHGLIKLICEGCRKASLQI